MVNTFVGAVAAVLIMMGGHVSARDFRETARMPGPILIRTGMKIGRAYSAGSDNFAIIGADFKPFDRRLLNAHRAHQSRGSKLERPRRRVSANPGTIGVRGWRRGGRPPTRMRLSSPCV